MIIRQILTRLRRDESGSYIVYMSLLMPAAIGIAGLGTEGGLMLFNHRSLQSAADSAAVSVASYYATKTSASSSALGGQANAVAANYGYVNGTNGVTVTVNNPPKSGRFTSNTYAFEVIVTKPQAPILSSIWLSSPVNISGRAVALLNVAYGGGEECVMALGKSSTGTNVADAITANGNAKINLTGCSLFTNSSDPDSIYFGPKGSASINLYEVNGKLNGGVGTAGGTSLSAASTINQCADTSCSISSPLAPTSGDAQLPDPYANLSVPSPSGCLTPPAADQCKKKKTVIPGWCLTAGNTTLSPGTYCGGIAVSGNSNVTLQSGVYVLATTSQNETGLNMSNGTTLTGSEVTLVFTSADGTYPPAGSDMMDLANGTTTTLTAPTTGPTAGLVILGDRSMPLGTSGQSSSTPTGAQFVVENGAVASLDGAVYLPNGAFSFEGNGGAVTPCTQIIANVIDLNNSGNLDVNCGVNNGGGAPDTLIGAIPLLVE